MKRFLVIFLMSLLCIIPVSAKEDKYTIVSGDINTVGSEICFDTECFYVIGNDGNVVKMLAKYNLYVGGKYENGTWTAYREEATGLQNSLMLGSTSAGKPYEGTVAFSTKSYWEDIKVYPAYVFGSGSITYDYVVNYKNYLEKLGILILDARLISYEELKTLGCSSSCKNTFSWVYSTNYWSGSANWGYGLYVVTIEGGFNTVDYNRNEDRGVRPVIEIPTGWFDKEGTVYSGTINEVKVSDGVVSNSSSEIDLVFNDLGQEVKYETIVYNDTDTVMYVNSLEVENSSEKFIEYRLDESSLNKIIEPNGASLVTFYVSTLKEEGAGRNLDDEVTFKLKISDSIYNPDTFNNWLEVILFLLLVAVMIYFIRKSERKNAKALVLVLGLFLFGVSYVKAETSFDIVFTGKIKYESQNVIMTTGTVLNDKAADYTNSKEVWAYYDKVKNVEVKSIIKKPKEYYKEFDLTEDKSERVLAYLTENGDKKVPYDLTIMSNGVVVANEDSSFMFSFPNTEKVEGLSNVDFRNTTTMQGMFIGNKKVEKVEVEAIELDNVTDTSYMFYDCDEIEHTKSDFNFENVTNTTMMFIPYLYTEVRDGAVVETDLNFSKSPAETKLQGVFISKESLENQYPIYYYRGMVDDNNVKFAGLCWQIVRTTETGGVKLVYNGTPNSDGSCKEPGVDISIGKSVFNSIQNSPISSGYMYGDVYKVKSSGIIKYSEFMSYVSLYNDSNKYFYSKQIEYNDGIYQLIDPVAKVWSESNEELQGYYTCKQTTTDGCSTIYYIPGNDKNNSSIYGYYILKLSGGKTAETDTFSLGGSYIKNADGSYSLTDIDEISKAYWYTNYKAIVEKEYYACSDLNSTTCDKMYRLVNSTAYVYYIDEIKPIVYANDVVYKDGKYKLKDTYKTDWWYRDYDKLAEKYHYTCLSENDECEEVYYISNFSNIYYLAYFTFNNGVTIETAKTDMFKNTNDSTIKTYIDNWYEENLSSYTYQLEDTIWCNDRSLLTGSLIGKDHNSKGEKNMFSAHNRIFIRDIIMEYDLSCHQKNDCFTVSEDNGNGDLKYPVGLLTVDEVLLSGAGYNYGTEKIGNTYYLLNYTGDTYLSNGSTTFFTMTPYGTIRPDELSFVYNYQGNIINYVSNSQDVRPAISLVHDIKYTIGDGTTSNPYVIE